MKRARSGKTIHRDDCPKAKSAVHWAWADHCRTETQFFVEMSGFPWLRLCQVCFTGSATELAVTAMLRETR
jgi:hypothetical protein